MTALYGLYGRSEWAYRIYQKSPDHPALVAARQDYDTRVGEMMAGASLALTWLEARLRVE